jgi:hypothetical protein
MNKVGVRFEVWVIALLAKKPGITWSELRLAAERLVEVYKFRGLKSVDKVLDYAEYLVKIGIVEERGGKLYLRVESLSSILLRYVKQLAESQAMNNLILEVLKTK